MSKITLTADERVYEIKDIYWSLVINDVRLVVFDHTFENRIYAIEDFDKDHVYWDVGFTDS